MLKRVLVITAGLWFFGTVAEAQKGPGDADYPPEALAKREQGTVLTDLTIGTNGRISDCKVVVSSNSPALDQATCKLLVSAARFKAARDANGNAILSHTPGEVTWVIPGCREASQADPRLQAKIQVHATITSLQRCR